MSSDLTTPFRTLLAEIGLDLYDLEFAGGELSVTVNRAGGVDLDAVTAANRAISAWLDNNDPIASHYRLDVSSPGLERKLRTPDHFASAVGEIVTCRQIRNGEATRRLEGVLVSATDTELVITDKELGEIAMAFDSVERAHTVFIWGSTAKPSPSKGRAGATSTRSK